MPEKFKWCKFSEVDLNDDFFTPLKEDYEEFSDWFLKKRNLEENALVF
ncbi:hypothetical protein [Methanolapillus ohkumae]|uniref:Uncharacterized protein n=1 Tax=Methanolapillus ohkumae TaxID=3028298 RepID=A0AA96V7Y2_9EURY|nr:hypothetical protein MsAm2_12720 [Methanosarcinaceae archaeon Am2]